MKPNELKALIDLKFHGVDNFQAKILKDKNVLNKPKRSEINAIIKTGEPAHLFEQLCKMAKHYGKHTSVTRTLSFALCDEIRSKVIEKYGTFENFYLTHDIERSFLDRLVNKRLVKMSPRVQNVCEILGIKY